MTTLDYLSDLRSQGIVITLGEGGDQLKVSAPKGAIDAEIKTELAARKAEILSFLQEATASQDQTLPPLVKRAPEEAPRLSAAQERVWKIHRLSPDDPTMNIAVPWRISGAIDLEILRQSLAILSERHETLRCRFPDRGGQPGMVVADGATIELEELTLERGLEQSTAEQLALASERVAAFAVKPFDVSEVVARAAIVEIDRDDHVLMMVFHQIVFDWGAANPVAVDLSQIYSALVQGDEPDLEPLEVSYLDYAGWQRDWLDGEGTESHRRYWADQLSRPYRPLTLPVRSDEVTENELTTPRQFELPPEVVERLAELGRRAGGTLYMTLLGAWQALLAGYGDADEAIVFSLLSINRPELKKLVGLFANPLPLRVDLSGSPTSVELIQRVGDATLGAYSHQELPLEAVMEKMKTEMVGGRGPFQSLFIFQHEPTAKLAIGDTRSELLTIGDHAAAFDLRLFAEETDAGLSGWLEYDETLFGPETADRLVEQFLQLLRTMADRPDDPVSELLPITAEEKQAAAASPGLSADGPAPFVAARTENEKYLVSLWGELFDREVGIDDDFFALGGHSLIAVSMFARIEESFGRSLPLATLFEAPTVRAVAEVLEQDDWQLAWTSIVPIKRSGNKRPLFCVAALGDEIIQFGELAELLSDDQPFYALQQGLDRTDEIRTTIPDIAAQYLREIRTIQPEGPYLIAGYCFGGLVAYEMAQQLQADGQELSPVLMIEAEAPGGIYKTPITRAERATRVVEYVRQYGVAPSLRYVRKRVGKIWRWVIWTRLRHLLHRGFDRFSLDLPESLKDILQINAQAADDYEPIMQPYDGDIVILRAEKLTPDFVYKEQLGWGALIHGTIESHTLPGDHEGIWKSPNVQEFAKRLEGVIDEFDRR